MFGTSFGNSASSGLFSPASIAGLKLWLNSDAANVNTEAAADFNGSNQYLSSTSTDFNKGNESFSFGCWVKVDSFVSNAGVLGKYLGTGNQRSYMITTPTSTSLRILIAPYGTGTGLTLIDFTGLTLSNYNFVVASYDHIAGKIKISVNGATYIESAHTTGAFAATTAPFEIGNQSDIYLDGKIDLAFFYDKALSLSEAQDIYNSGNATSYADLTDAQKISLVSWWSLSENSGVRYDQVIASANNLTDNNSVGWAAGVLSEPVVDGAPVSKVTNLGDGATSATQGTALNQPVWHSSGFGTNSTPYLDFDGANSFLTLGTEYSKLSNHTVFYILSIDVSQTQSPYGEFNSGGQTYSGGITLQTWLSGTLKHRHLWGDGVNGSNTTSNASMVINTPYIGVEKYVNGDDFISDRLNGVALTATKVSSAATSIAGDKFNLSIGRLGDFAGSYFNGKFSEMLIYDAVLTPSEIESVETYLNAKYAAY